MVKFEVSIIVHNMSIIYSTMDYNIDNAILFNETEHIQGGGTMILITLIQQNNIYHSDIKYCLP